MAVKIPKCMSTQHPDNAGIPFFAENTELGGEDEIQEAYYVFSHLGCDEQMWDCEGKEVDNFVVKKLLTKYEYFFRDKKLGKDLFITLRVPNPEIERTEAKILLETLESIPRSFDAARVFYQDGTPPLFEVILPMTTSAKCLDRIYRYYCDFVVGKQNKLVKDITIGEWIGEFKPERINVIPLFEDVEYMLNAHNITKEYLQDKDVDYQRVFLARSDPAMNYGFVSAVLLNKIALQKLQVVSEDVGVEIYPIVGIGSAPFRGNFKPSTVERILKEYPSVHTFTIQSAFKYDNSPEEVRKAIRKIQGSRTDLPQEVDEQQCLEVIKKHSQEYRRQVVKLTSIINELAKYVPSRRKRKLHVGLFGYSRNLKGIKLPRAITFTAALYSIGLPPEILGLNAIEDLQFVKEIYVNFENDLRDALKYLNPNVFHFLNLKELKDFLKDLNIEIDIDEEHRVITNDIIDSLRKNRKVGLEEYVLRAASLRGFLG